MKPIAKKIKTPIGVLPAPLAPNWTRRLAACETNNDLFNLVRVDGFINPDALNEVMARGLYGVYERWRKGIER